MTHRNVLCIPLLIAVSFLTPGVPAVRSDAIAQVPDEIAQEPLTWEKTVQLHLDGLQSIPRLIKQIDQDKKTGLQFWLLVPPTESVIPPYVEQDHCFGIYYAYLVEWILARESPACKKVTPGFFLNCPEQHIFKYGLILPVSRESKVLKMDDMKKVRKLYEQWWDKNKMKPLGVLRKEYKEGNKPLKGSDYYWL